MPLPGPVFRRERAMLFPLTVGALQPEGRFFGHLKILVRAGRATPTRPIWRLYEIRHAKSGTDQRRHAAGHALHRDEVGAAFTPVREQRDIAGTVEIGHA